MLVEYWTTFDYRRPIEGGWVRVETCVQGMLNKYQELLHAKDLKSTYVLI
jgi:hypothetical protein